MKPPIFIVLLPMYILAWEEAEKGRESPLCVQSNQAGIFSYSCLKPPIFILLKFFHYGV